VRGDVVAHKITAEDGVLYEALAVAQPDLLPSDYRSSLPHCGTPLMLALAADIGKADPQVQYFVRYLLSAPSVRKRAQEPTLDTATLTHPELAATALHKARVAAATSQVLLTAHFEIDYETAGGDATTLAYAQQIGTMMEFGYASEIGASGFTAPVAPQDGFINVVLKSAVPCPVIPFVDIPCSDLLGAAVPASLTLTSLGDPTVYLLTSYSTGNDMATTGAHEFFHLVQYQAGGILPNVISPWWMEGGATAMETVVYPSIYDYVGWLQGGNGFYAKTDYPLEAMSYEAVIFHRFLMEKYSGGNSVLMRDALNALGSTSSSYLAVQGALTSRGTSWEEAMHQFGLWNFFTGARTMPGYYAAANQYPTFNNFSANHTMSNSVPTVPAASMIVEPHGSKYIQIRPDASLTSQRKLTVKVDGDSFGGVRGWVVTRRQNGATDIQDLGFAAGLPNTNLITINDFSYGTVGEVVIILTNTGISPELVATYEVKLAVPIDLAFCMDTTGSMSGSINAIKSTATSAMQTLGSNGADFRIAITEYKDFPCCGGSSGDFPYLPDSPFSNQPSVILGGINMLVASGGGDWPESQFSGIMGAINAAGIGPWRSDAKKAIVVMTDAPPKDPEPVTGYTAASVAAAAQAGGIVVNNALRPVALFTGGSQPRTATAGSTPIVIYGVVVGGDSSAYASLAQLTSATGGKVFTASYNTTDIATALLQAIGEISSGANPPPPPPPPPPPANHAPDVSGAIATPSRLWPPDSKMVPIAIGNVTDSDGDAITIQVTTITQDEPLSGKNPDGTGVGTATASVRAARDGKGNGRVYAIGFTATDSKGGSASGKVTVCVPHDQGGNTTCNDDGQIYVSTKP
jgi:hypothetical protein